MWIESELLFLSGNDQTKQRSVKHHSDIAKAFVNPQNLGRILRHQSCPQYQVYSKKIMLFFRTNCKTASHVSFVKKAIKECTASSSVKKKMCSIWQTK